MIDELGITLAVGEILGRADVDIAGRRAVCNSSGRCCHFEAWGHRLYVTGVEAVHFSRVEGVETRNAKHETRKGSISLPQFFAKEVVEGCPYQVGGMCTARAGRPLGCRVYFCDENAKGWQEEVYEKYHAELKGVHERFGVPYRYVEWRVALKEMMGWA